MTENAGQARQNRMYAFPYHYLVQFDDEGGGFRMNRVLSAGYRYASYLLDVMETLQALRFDSLVDVGCGDGRVAGLMAERFPGAQVVGVDVSEEAIALARGLNARTNLAFHVTDITRSRPEGAPFEAGTLIEVLEHVPPEAVPGFVAAIGDLLAPGAPLVVTVPSVNLDVTRISRHHQHFVIDTLRDAMAPVFELKEARYLNRGGIGSAMLDRLFSNGLFTLKHQKALDVLFRVYRARYAEANEKDGLRILATFERA